MNRKTAFVMFTEAMLSEEEQSCTKYMEAHMHLMINISSNGSGSYSRYRNY